ncbi:MAG: hypothetical protein IKT40_03345 [Bacilli bacterium]|nr:hypothetical protein [Bacilli bacterium]
MIMKKKVKDCTKNQIFEAIYNESQTSISDNNCEYCKYHNTNSYGTICDIRCDEEYESCIDFKGIIKDVGEEEIEVEDE